ncbi:MAG: phosphoribosylglycinamide formyltransferase [Deinococcus sp.]
MRLSFLASHGGSGMGTVLEAARAGELDAEGMLCISNNSGSRALALARDFGLDTLHLSARQLPVPDELDRAMLDALQGAGTDMLILSGYLKELGPLTLGAYSGRVLNVHPSLLPKFGGPGMYGDRVHASVLVTGEAESGASVYLVTPIIDGGPVLARSRVPVLPGDTVETLRTRVQATEGPLLVGVLRGWAARQEQAGQT